MAIDHALLESVQRGGRPVLRLYRWTPACLSLGRNQHARSVYDAAAAAALGIDIVRRPTGGLAVLHDQELTYCVLAPVHLLGGPRAAYHAINRALLDALRELGVAASLAGPAQVRDPRRMAADPCFRAPAEGEVTVAGRKLVGSAQRCDAGVLLQHGSILIDGSQERVVALLRSELDPVGAHRAATRRSVAGAALADTADESVTLRELLGHAPAAEVVADAVCGGFERLSGIPLAPVTLTREEARGAGRLAAHYEDPEWTWRL